MNEELRARAIEAVARADYESWREHRFAKRWENLTLEQRSVEQAKIAPHVNAALAVVADWCDERRAAILSGPPTSDSVIEMCVGYTRAGCRSAFADVAGACRPVGEDQT